MYKRFIIIRQGEDNTCDTKILFISTVLINILFYYNILPKKKNSPVEI